MSNNKPAVLGSIKNAAAMLQTGRGRLQEALPRNVDADRFISIVVTTIQQTPDLLKCTKNSFFIATLRCAQLALEPLFGQAYILPYYNKKRRVHEAQFLLGYQGMIELHLRSGYYRHIEAQVVYEGEHFVYERGLNPRLEHTPGPPKGMEELKAAYTIARPKDGGDPVFDVMWKHELNLVAAKAQSQAVWGDPQSYPEMCKKTVVRRHSKYLKKTPELAQVVALDDAVGFGDDVEVQAAMDIMAGMGNGEEMEEPSDEVKARQEELKKQLAAVKEGLEKELEETDDEEDEEPQKEEPQKAEKSAKGKQSASTTCKHKNAEWSGEDLVCMDCGEVLEEEEPPEEQSDLPFD